MNRQPSLAEILSDDTGRIRAEVADLLMEPRPLLRPVVRQAGRQPLHRAFPVNGWVVVGAVVLICIAIVNLSGSNPDRANNVTVVPQNALHEGVYRPVVESVSPVTPVVEPKEQPDQVAENDDQNQSTEIRQDVRPPEAPPYWTGKTGRVIGNSVPILTKPGIGGRVITTVLQSENLSIFSFDGGWYRVALPTNNTIGYIFGADFVSHNIDSYPYRIAVVRGSGIKLLVKDEGYENHLQVVQPDGDSRWVLRDGVLLDVYR